MKVEIFTLCDFASVDASGKMNVLGSFDRMNALQAPIIHPLCALAIKCRFEKIEEGPKRVRVSIIDTDGRLVMPMLEAQTQIALGPDSSTATAQLVLIIPQIKLPSFGEYSIDLAVDGRQEASTPLYVKQIPLVPPMQRTTPPEQPQLPPAQ
jgi:hypothetical protein